MPTAAASEKIDAYIHSRSREVNGWLSRCDGEIFSVLLKAQTASGVKGAVVETGVHHGKTFIPLALGNEGQRCYAIDIFGRQDLNRDASGSGDKAIFVANLKKFGLDPEGIHIDERLSTQVTRDDIERQVGMARFFHVDGGHDVDTVVGDLKLAQAVSSDQGIIAVDDVFRPEWPEVSMGLFAFLADRQGDFIPFAIGYNKTYLCRRGSSRIYREALKADTFLRMYFSKSYQVSNDEIAVFQRYPQPEWSFRRRVFNYLTTYHPDFAFRLKTMFGR